MRWEDERYVKLYTRTTLTTRRLGWEGRAVLWELFRKVDRAGITEIGEEDPVEALSALTELPLEVCAVAWPRLSGGAEPVVTIATVTQRDRVSRALFIPNFLPAQEAKQTDRARKEKQRELARAHLIVPLRDQSSQGVTNSHERSHGVTPSLAVPRLDEEERTLAPSSARRTQVPPANAPPEQPSLLAEEVGSGFVQFVRAEWPDVKNAVELEKRARAAFPAVDPLVEARKARGWELSDPRRRKVKHGRFLWDWLGRAQQDANRNGHGHLVPPAPGSTQRDRAYEQTKRELDDLRALKPVPPPRRTPPEGTPSA